MSLCPRCIKEEKEVTMEIEGTKLRCPQCTFSREFPRRMPTLKEAFQIIASKEAYIAELEDENTELKLRIQQLERR